MCWRRSLRAVRGGQTARDLATIGPRGRLRCDYLFLRRASRPPVPDCTHRTHARRRAIARNDLRDGVPLLCAPATDGLRCEAQNHLPLPHAPLPGLSRGLLMIVVDSARRVSGGGCLGE